jgi:hypothetical protein
MNFFFIWLTCFLHILTQVIYLFIYFGVVGIGPKASYMLSQCSAAWVTLPASSLVHMLFLKYGLANFVWSDLKFSVLLHLLPK